MSNGTPGLRMHFMTVVALKGILVEKETKGHLSAGFADRIARANFHAKSNTAYAYAEQFIMEHTGCEIDLNADLRVLSVRPIQKETA